MNQIMAHPAAAEPVSSEGFLPEDATDLALRADLIAAGAWDACVRRRIGSDGSVHRVAYAATARPVALAGSTAIRVVPISRLPRSATGTVDMAALAALVVPDGADPARLIQRLPAAETTWRGPPAPSQEDVRCSDRLAILDGGPVPALREGISCLADILVDAAARVPDRGVTLLSRDAAPALLSYAELDREARTIAAALHGAGLGAGGTALCVFRDDEDTAALTAIWGAIYAGLKPVPLLAPHRYSQGDAQSLRLSDAATLLPEATILAAGAAKAVRRLLPMRVVLDPSRLPAASPMPPVVVEPQTPAAFFLTSGSTAKPKVVPQTHHAILSLIAGCAEINGLSGDDISLNWLPMDHVGSFIMLHLRDAYLGARQIRAVGSDVLRDPLVWVNWLSEYRVTNGWAPNFAFELVVSALKDADRPDWDLSSLRFLHNGGEAVIRDTAAAFLRALSPFGIGRGVVRPAWGMSETSSGSVFNPGFDPLSDAAGPIPVGVPCPGLKVRITDPADPARCLYEGQSGLLQVAGPMVLKAYDRNPEKTRESFAAPGWFDTGDLGRIEAGMLYITGRNKDVIIVNGLNLSPAEIETRIGRIEGVMPSCTAVLSVGANDGVPDLIAVFFVPEAGAARESLVQTVRRVLSAEMGLPTDMVFVLEASAVPKTSIGKIQKEKLRAMAEAGTLVPVWRRDRTGGMAMPALWRCRWQQCPAVAAPGQNAVTLCGPGDAALATALKRLGVRASRVTARALAGQEIGLVPASTLVLMPGVVRNAFDAVPIVQGLIRLSHQHPVRLIWLAPGAALGGDARGADAAMLTALLRTAEAEHPALSARIVDPGCAPLDARDLRDEIADPARQSEVLWSESGRAVRQLVPLTAPEAQGPALQRHGRYVVTGGLGGIGRKLCAHLQERYEAELVILGRRSEDALSDAGRDALAALRQDGKVSYRACDLSTEQAGSTLETLTCDGIFHLAGLAESVPVAQAHPARLAREAQAKIAGTEALIAQASRMGASWIAAFGSVIGTMGGGGYVGYAMANRYLQARAGAPSGCRLIALNWSMWEGLGLSADIGDSARVAQKGYDVMSAERALAALEPALSSGVPSVHIGLDGTCLPMAADLSGPTVVLAGAQSDPAAETPTDTLTDTLRLIWQDILKLPVLPGGNDSIFDMGATSLDLPRAQERMARDLGIETDVLDLFDKPVIADFAALLR